MARSKMHDDFDWEDLRHFAAFLEERTLSGAAKRLGVDHVTVSRRITALERSLDVKLLDRRSRIPQLAPAATRMAPLALGVAEAAERMLREARRLVPEVTGSVTVSAPPSLATTCIAPRLGTLRARHGSLRVVLIGEKRIASLARGEADVAVRLVRPAQRGLVLRKLASTTFRLYATATYLAEHPPAAREVIETHGDASLPQHRWMRQVLPRAKVALATSDLDSQLAAACAGMGLAVLPGFLAERQPELVPVPTRARPLVRDVWLAVHADLREVPAIRAVIDFLVDVLHDVR